MKRAGLLALPMCGALALPVLPLWGQDAEPTEAQFPWPDFLEVTPVPGQYRMTAVVENVEMPNWDGGKDMPPADEMMGEPDVQYLCLAGEPERVDWLEEFSGDATCTAHGPTGTDDAFQLGVLCVEPDGSQNDVRLTGSATDQGMDMQMAMTMRFAETSKMSMDMHITIERVGDCE